jgi:hypothetical protein
MYIYIIALVLMPKSTLATELLKRLEKPIPKVEFGKTFRRFCEEKNLTRGQKQKLTYELRELGQPTHIQVKWIGYSSTRELVSSNEKVTPLQLGLALQPKGYYCFQAALYCLGHSGKYPSTFDIAKERPNYSASTNFDLSKIDLRSEFQKPARYSSNIATHGLYSLRFIEREDSHEIGVVDIEVDNSIVRSTSIERTLVDCAVSPHYVGGFSEVLQIYRQANGTSKLDIDKLIQTYSGMTLRYPYWQRIGFCLSSIEKSLATKWKEAFGAPHFEFFAEKEFKSTWKKDSDWMLYYAARANKSST